MRQRGRFAGFSLYASNTTDGHDGDHCYKDGPELPPLDFNTDCFTNGRYVIFYNERFEKKYPVDYETIWSNSYRYSLYEDVFQLTFNFLIYYEQYMLKYKTRYLVKQKKIVRKQIYVKRVFYLWHSDFILDFMTPWSNCIACHTKI